jgi:hypothetical protein
MIEEWRFSFLSRRPIPDYTRGARGQDKIRLNDGHVDRGTDPGGEFYSLGFLVGQRMLPRRGCGRRGFKRMNIRRWGHRAEPHGGKRQISFGLYRRFPPIDKMRDPLRRTSNRGGHDWCGDTQQWTSLSRPFRLFSTRKGTPSAPGSRLDSNDVAIKRVSPLFEVRTSSLSPHPPAPSSPVGMALACCRWALPPPRRDGRSEPMPRGGSISPWEKYSQRILAPTAEQPDLTLNEMVCALRKRRIQANRSALSRFFARHDITAKKSLQAAERKCADVARARRWIREQGFPDPAGLVFFDETAVNTNMVRPNAGALAECAWSAVSPWRTGKR